MKIADDTSESLFSLRWDETILIAENNHAVRQYMREALYEKGYTIIEPIDGVDAITKFKQNQCIDLIILDSVMKKKSGYKIYEEINRIAPLCLGRDIKL